MWIDLLQCVVFQIENIYRQTFDPVKKKQNNNNNNNNNNKQL